jgi:predicted enzyme related to lactoylglutathione lyase
MNRTAMYGPPVINGGHVIIYSADPEADRAFFADVLAYPHLDAGGGWLIFKLPPTEIAMHPAGGSTASHEFYLMCDDIDATVEELTAKGVEFSQPVTEERWGRLVRFQLPGGGELGMYEPRHDRATDL